MKNFEPCSHMLSLILYGASGLGGGWVTHQIVTYYANCHDFCPILTKMLQNNFKKRHENV